MPLRKVLTAIWMLPFVFLSTAAIAQDDERIINGVSYVGVAVSDLDRATTMFTDVFDLEVVTESTIAGSSAFDTLAGRAGVVAKTRLLMGNNAQIRLMQFESPSPEATATPGVPVEGPGMMHLCFQVMQERRTYQRFLEFGGRTIGDPEMAQLNPRRTVYYAYAHDFDDRIIEIEHIDRGDRGSYNPDVLPRVRHLCILTPDIERLLPFYTAFFETNPRRVGPLTGEAFDAVAGYPNSELKMSWTPIRTFELEVNQFLSHPTELPDTPRPVDAPGYNMMVFDVTDIAAASRRITDAGGTMVTEPSSLDDGDIAFARDPDGNLLGLFKVGADSDYSSSRFAR